MTRLGSSTTGKVDFDSLRARARIFKEGLKLGYEFIRVSEFTETPRCCFNCRPLSNMKSACTSSTPKCAIFARPHISTKELLCRLSANCVNCGECHVSFSLKCHYTDQSYFLLSYCLNVYVTVKFYMHKIAENKHLYVRKCHKVV